MKSKGFLFAFVVLVLCCWNSTVSAQGIKSFLERLDQIEKSLNRFDGEQKKDIQTLKEQISEIRTGGDVSGIENSVDLLSLKVSELEKQIDEINDFIIKDAIPPDVVDDLRESIRELREAIETAPGPAAETGESTETEAEALITLEVGADAAVMSKYVWRGILLTDDPVLQPSLTVGCGDVSINIWGSMDLTDVNGNDKEINELDFTLDYSFAVSSLDVSTGVIRYTFPNTGYDSTTELYASFSSEMTGNFSLTAYQDVGETEGTYFSAGTGAGISVGELTTIDISGSLNWGSAKNNNFYYGYDGGGVTDVLIGVSAAFGIGEYVTVTPAVMFSSIVNHKIRDSLQVAGTERDIPVFGVTLSAAY